MNSSLAKKVSTGVVKEAGNLLMRGLNKVKKVSFKAKSDILTDFDIKSEKIILNRIKKVFPTHNILSEEEGFIDKHSKYTWVIDPIDGTINYYHANAPFRIGLCLLKNKKPIIATLYNPIKKELYFAEKGKGAKLNNKNIHVNNNSKLENSVVMTHLSSKKEARIRIIHALENIFSKTLQIRMFGSGLAAMCYVASGRFHIFFNAKTSPWDILPGALLVEEAGGRVTDIYGNKITLDSDSVLATNGKVHREMLKLLRNV